MPPKTGVSPRKRALILRQRYFEFESLCQNSAGEGLAADTGASKYLSVVLEGATRLDDPDLAAVILDWLGAPLSPAWHFYIADANNRRYFVNDTLVTAVSDHPDLSAMRRLCRLSRRCELAAEAHREIEEDAATAADWADWADEGGQRGVSSDLVKLEILTQKIKLFKYMQQYVARLGISQR